MSSNLFIKRYDDVRRCSAAAAHHDWLTGLKSEVRLPHLITRASRHLVFERLPGRTPEVADLPRVASTLGRLHDAAYRRELHSACLDQPHTTSTGLVLPDFAGPRREALHRAARVTCVDLAALDAVLDRPCRPAAFYKDPNVRNYLVEGENVAVVDFDDLTLAPFGYDLAGLLVTASMTYGRLDERILTDCVEAYRVAIVPNVCELNELRQYAELHHLLTLRYLGANGYQHPWPTVRPWPDPFAST
ncbi:phosphotransferase [Plantactinospora soyae]|uniref:Ser/Thr protein kinase RdoA (MazF antagonist) n=1 Tax=Plantactinospora soyae TaxID=1544732 RepID=A0A927M5R9_9ACTN|nr:phosphotransferase [Plantactinospora soyae]MBE1487497.1 Ser/Thr protein kinase RdoA (MazF antagonist) [Plantactinospora soyae]